MNPSIVPLLNGQLRSQRQAPTRGASAIVASGNQQRVSDNHNGEVINNNEHPGFPAITGRL